MRISVISFTHLSEYVNNKCDPFYSLDDGYTPEVGCYDTGMPSNGVKVEYE